MSNAEPRLNLVFMPIVPDVSAGPNDTSEQASLVADVLTAQLDLYARTGASLPWIGYFALDPVSRDVLGSCSFVAPPADGSVEIAYFTFPHAEGHGIGRAMAAKLIEISRADGSVTSVIAHTLPQENASTGILRRLGFAQTGWAVDHEAGDVWQWTLKLSEA
jgi:RimJ/RimL family protein N-acetyltransferase